MKGTPSFPSWARVVAPSSAAVFLLFVLPGSAAGESWSPAGQLFSPVSDATATLLQDGQVLVAGGSNFNTYPTLAQRYDPATGAWSTTGSMLKGRFGHTATLLPSGKVLIVGGISSGGAPGVELFDPATGTWSATGALITQRDHHTATLLKDGRVLVAGGSDFSGNPLASAEIYDPPTGLWTAAASQACAARTGHTATRLTDGRVLVAGGWNGSASSTCADLYNPALGTWSLTGSLNLGRDGHTASLLPNGTVLAVNGNTAELYNPATGLWAFTGGLASIHILPAAALLADGRVLVSGTSCEIYNPASGTWAATAPMHTPRSSEAGTLMADGRVLIAGGYGMGWLASAEIFDPAISPAATWAFAAGIGGPRQDHTTTLLPSGKVLLAAGRATPTSVASAFLYDPVAGTWTPTSSLAVARNNHSATLLASGQVLVVGGEGNPNVSLATAERYDPVAATWSAAGALATERREHTASLLPDGRVLVGGGFRNATSLALKSAELYDPVTNGWTVTGGIGTERAIHTATTLTDGRVLFAGGTFDPTDPEGNANVDIWDPLTGTSTPVASLATPRYRHAAALLPDGRVIVAGGLGLPLSPPTASAEIYDPRTGTWTATGSLVTARHSHTATVMHDGRVMVAGGRNLSGAVGTVELYDPTSGTWTPAGTLATARSSHTGTLLPDGSVLMAGGSGVSVLSSTERGSILLYSPARRPVITSASGAIAYGGPALTVTGTGFGGDSESNSGNRVTSATNYPLLNLRAIEGDQAVWLAPDPRPNLSDSPMTVMVSAPPVGRGLPPTIAPGWHRLTVFTNGVPSAARLVQMQCSVAILQHPLSQTVPLGGTATFSVGTQGARSFQWQKNGLSIPGANAPTYTTPPVAAADSGATFSVVVTGVCPAAVSVSSPAVLSVADALAPDAAVLSPSGGEYLLLSDAAPPAHTHLVTWSMSDNIRICQVDVSLLYSNDGGTVYAPAPAGGGLPASFGPGGTCVFPGEGTTSVLYTIPTDFPSGVSGSLYKIQVVVTDHVGLQTTAVSPNPFYIVQSNPDSVKTLILSNVGRMQTQMGVTPAEAGALTLKLHELSNHPRVLGFVVDLNGVTQLTDLYAAWDADPGNRDKANAVLFGCHAPLPPGCAAERDGIHDVLQTLLGVYSGVRSVVLVGDDRIIPMARLSDRTVLFLESNYPAGGDLTPTGTTVGRALAGDNYLSDDPLVVRDSVRPDELSATLFIPDLAVGRLVEKPAEITTAISTYIAQDGILDLTALDPVTGHKVLVTGYDFLGDGASLVRERWKGALGVSTPDGSLAPVDGSLVGGNWNLGSVAERRAALRTHLAGNGGERYGVTSLSGHASHSEEGVPGNDPFDIQGLSAVDIYGTDACGTPSLGALDLAGGIVYAVGCHGGLPVAGSCTTDAEHSLDLAQTFLSRGVQTYLANTGYGWGLVTGVGYGERLMKILSEELTSGGTVVTGEAVLRAKNRYYLELPHYDAYDEKSLMQWTLYGLPMYAIRTGVPEGGPRPFTGPAPRAEEQPAREDLNGAEVRRSVGAGGLPPYLTQVNLHFDFTAAGVYQKRDAAGAVVTTPGCPNPEGCYYALNGLSIGQTDLPIQPYFVYDSRLSGTSQHGVLWKGGVYEEETGWVSITGELQSNGGDGSNHGSAAKGRPIDPIPQRLLPGADPPGCRPSDLELNSVVVVTGEDWKAQDSDPTYSIERHYREVDLETLYFNNTLASLENCDREGPGLGTGPYHQLMGNNIEWAVPATDASGVWRVLVVVNDNTVDAQGRGAWAPVELVDDGTGVWRGSRVAGSPRVTYVIQAVDNRGNVTWLDFVPAQLPSSGVDPELPEAVEVLVTPEISISDAGVIEGDAGTTQATFTVTLSEAFGQALTVSYATLGGTATEGVDYVPSAGVLSFAPGVTALPVSVDINGDLLDEPAESFTLNLTATSSGLIVDGTGTGTITDDDAAPILTLADATQAEGDSGSSPMGFLVTLSTPSGQVVGVEYSTADGTATAGSDYVAASGSLSFAPGETSQSVPVILNGDSLNETDEGFTLSLSSPTNASIGSGQATGTIQNDDAAPALSVADVTATEGDAGTTAAVFQVVLSAASAQTITVSFATADGTATSASDYTTASGGLTFAPGTIQQAVSIDVNGDVLDEADESFFVNLSNPGVATIADGQGVGTIGDDDLPTQVSIGDVTVVEGNAGIVTASFPVTLSVPSGQVVGVDFQTADGSATAGTDYATASGTLTFAPGTTIRSVDIGVVGDTLDEPDETFLVNLTGMANATTADGQAVGEIMNDDTGIPIPIAHDELVHGSRESRSVGSPGSTADTSLFRISQKPRSSYEVMVDAVTGDLGPSGPELDRIGSDGVTPVQGSLPAGAGSARVLRWESLAGTDLESIRVRSAGCGLDCDAYDTYRIRAWDTTASIARVNNSASQVTILILQNLGGTPVSGHLWFQDSTGATVASPPFNIDAHGSYALNTGGLVPGISGSLTVSSDAGYGLLQGKAVALETATGFTFDTELRYRPR